MPARERAAAPPRVPPALAEAVAGYGWSRDLVGEAGAKVHRLHAPGRPTLYLKSGRGEVADAVADELARLRWLNGRLGAPAVVSFLAEGDGAWLLTSAAPGRTAWQALDGEPERRGEVVDALAAHLRALHDLPVGTCPFDASLPVRLAHARRRIDAGEVVTDDFDPEHDGWTAQQVWDALQALRGGAANPVVTHGDYSLDNLLLEGGRVTGCIDVGRLGVADRWQDLAILWSCLGEFDAGLQPRLLAAYGVRLNRRNLKLHLLLDELF